MKGRALNVLTGLLALLSLAVCLATPVLYFLGRVSEGAFKAAFLIASIGWFVFAVARGSSAKGPAAPAP
jgi:hypothetical protein